MFAETPCIVSNLMTNTLWATFLSFWSNDTWYHNIFLNSTLQISIAYPSGTRKELGRNEQEMKICKAIVQERSSGEVVKSIISILRETNKKDTVNAGSLIIPNESKELCKQNSRSTLQRKDNSWYFFIPICSIACKHM